MRAALKSFPKGSAAAWSGDRPGHLRAALHCPSSPLADLFLSKLTEVVNFCLAGRVEPSLAPLFTGAILHAFVKPSKGLRPIAVGEALRRLAAKLMRQAR